MEKIYQCPKQKALGDNPGAFKMLIYGGYGQSTDRRRAC